MKLEAEKYFIEFGARALLPTDASGSYDSKKYGGVVIEMGADYYLNNNPNASPYWRRSDCAVCPDRHYVYADVQNQTLYGSADCTECSADFIH
jgi:hypothetical protein